MLTSDLVRARTQQGKILPRYLKHGDFAARERAEELITAFKEHVGKTKGELEETISAAIGDGTDFILWRGLSKLLFDRTEFTIESPIPCEDLRRTIFEESAKLHPVVRDDSDSLQLHTDDGRRPTKRSEVLQKVAASLNITTEALERAMYADLEDAQLVSKFDTLTPDELVARYNLALVQAILFRAVQMRVEFFPEKTSRLRQIFRFIKFYRLMYQVRPIAGGGYLLILDGPVSVFRMSQKYGIQLAAFFPGLLLCPRFTMQAEVLWGKEDKPLLIEVSDETGLRSHYRDDGHYVFDEGKWLEERWAQLKIPWELSREAPPINLDGKSVMVPDYTIRAKDGREAYLEIIGYWRKGYLESRFELIKASGPTNLILAISDRFRVSEEELAQLPARAFLYKGTIIAKDLLELVEKCAIQPTIKNTEEKTEEPAGAPGLVLKPPKEAKPTKTPRKKKSDKEAGASGQ
jgi:predicted nuclease of restriction endonuclease-like RecB superfamily